MSWRLGLNGRLRSVAFSSLRGYRRSWLAGDLLAAVTLLVIAVPEQLATSRLAGMPPITGFFAFIAGSVLFAVLGSSPQMSVGADSTIAPLFAVGVGALAAAGSPRYVELVGLLAVVVGVFVALVGLLRLGWVAEFLSAPIISGFMAGVAVIIVVHQLPDLLGLPAVGGSTAHRLVTVVGHLGDARGWTVGIGIGVIATVLVAERIDRRLPGTLLAVVVTTALVAVLNLHGHGVAVLGTVTDGVPHVGLHGLSWSALRHVVTLAGVVALVVITQTAATTRAFADRGGYVVDVNRDFLGVGMGSVAAGLLGSFPVNASPPRTAVVAAASGRTQITGLAAAAGLAALIPAAWILRDVPVATLAGVLILVAARILHLPDLVAIARFDLFELGLAVVTLVTVALVGVEQGIGVAVGLAILDRTRLSARPQLHVLGRVPDTTSWAPLSGAVPTVQVPTVLVVLFATPLWYANSTRFRTEFDAAMSRAHGKLRLVVLDAAGMSDLDYTGSRVLGQILDQLEHDQIQFVIARADEAVRTSLDRSGLLARIGAEHLYPSVDAAVTQSPSATTP
ncbi:MAG: SulP family inorganic anion transporter [Jatrophihabitans sp.]